VEDRVTQLRRITARLIDAVLELGVAGFLAIGWIHWLAGDDWGVLGLMAVAGLIVVVVVGAYEIGFVAWRGQTPGKMATRIRVVTRTGGRVGWGRAALRLAPLVVVVVPGIGYVIAVAVYGWFMVDADGRGLHDRLAGTVVVPVAPGPGD
jgi:uncharacterized RDD family membrane protein YckC